MATKTLPKQPVIQWTYQRRSWLVNALSGKYPYYGSYVEKMTKRDFQDEAGKKFPSLAREIEAHNKRVDIENNKACEANRKTLNRLTAIARLGTEKQCDQIAKELL